MRIRKWLRALRWMIDKWEIVTVLMVIAHFIGLFAPKWFVWISGPLACLFITMTTIVVLTTSFMWRKNNYFIKKYSLWGAR